MRRALLILSLALFAIPLAASAQGPCLSQTIGRGSKGSEVLTLQKYLVAQKLLAADGATGYFGAMSEAAVQAWQRIYGPVSAGTPATTGFGMVGAKTRALLCAAIDARATPTAAATPAVSVTPPAPVVTTPPVQVGVGNPPNIQSFRATPDRIEAPGESVLLSWSVFEAQSCALYKEDGTRVVGGRRAQDTYVVMPDTSNIYQLSCLGTGDSSTSTPMSATTTRRVTVVNAAPTCEITLSKTSYTIGDTIRLSWKSTDADTGSWQHALRDIITLPYGNVDAAGQYFIGANAIGSQTVQLTVTGKGGTGTCAAGLVVRAPSAAAHPSFLSQVAGLGAGLLYPPVRR